MKAPRFITALAFRRRRRGALQVSLGLQSPSGQFQDQIMKKIGMILLAVYLILDALLGFGVNIGAAVFLLYLVAFAAGILILIGALKSSS
jgi:hypothetical protein